MQMIASKRSRKYLLYALGEILLVVLGILIALQVDTWNESRKNRNQLNLLFEDTRDYLLPVSSVLTPFVKKYRKLDSIITLLKEPPDPGYYRDNSKMTRFLFNDSLVFKLKKFYWVSPGITELIEKKTDFPPTHRSLMIDLVTWEALSQDLELLSGDYEAYLESVRRRLIDKAPYLLETDAADRKAAIDFVIGSGWYRYELERIGEYAKDMVQALDLQRSVCAELYGEIEIIHKKAKASRIDSLMHHMLLQPASLHKGPSLGDEKPAPNFVPNRGIFVPGSSDTLSWWHVLINTTGQEITFQVVYVRFDCRTVEHPAK